MKYRIFFLLSVVLCAAVLDGCTPGGDPQKEDPGQTDSGKPNPNPNPGDPDPGKPNPDAHIYISGYNGVNAICWKDGTSEVLNKTSYGANAYGLYVSGQDAHVVGWEKNRSGSSGVYMGKYWKNGTEVEVAPPGEWGKNSGGQFINACYEDIVVAGNDIYVAGYETNNASPMPYFVAKYWKNKTVIALSNGRKNAYATSIAVVGGNVYVAGSEQEGSYNAVKYWKNGMETKLTNGSKSAWANVIAVSGSDVYVGGNEDSKATYWKNNAAVILPNGTAVEDIFISGSDVYAAGYGGKVAKYWKNGTEVNLTDGSQGASANSIVVSNGDIYVAGYEGNIAKYWKNGTGIGLTNGSQKAVATKIFVIR